MTPLYNPPLNGISTNLIQYQPVVLKNGALLLAHLFAVIAILCSVFRLLLFYSEVFFKDADVLIYLEALETQVLSLLKSPEGYIVVKTA